MANRWVLALVGWMASGCGSVATAANVRLQQVECDGHVGDACESLGLDCASGLGVPKAKASTRYGQGCDADNLTAASTAR